MIPLHISKSDNDNKMDLSPAQKNRQRSNKTVSKVLFFGIIIICSTFLIVFVLRLQSSYQAETANDLTKVANKVEILKAKESVPDYHHSNLWADEYSIDHNGHREGRNEHEVRFKPLVISGPSGVGKGTLINKLIDFYNHKVDKVKESHEFQSKDIHELFGFSVSHTTRGPRPGEVDGVHYHFTNKDEMLKRIEQNEFVEYAEVHGNLYGTSYQSVQNVISSERICILDIDVQGAQRVKENSKLLLQPYFIFIAPPSIEELEQRLRGRGTETEEAIQRRIGNAKKEMAYGMIQGNFNEVIVNNNLEVAFLHLRQILEEWYPHLNQVASPSYEF